MTSLRSGRKPHKRAAPSQLPLFEHAEAMSVHNLPPMARRLARRWGVAPSTARILAELAGFSMEDK